MTGELHWGTDCEGQPCLNIHLAFPGLETAKIYFLTEYDEFLSVSLGVNNVAAGVVRPTALIQTHLAAHLVRFMADDSEECVLLREHRSHLRRQL